MTMMVECLPARATFNKDSESCLESPSAAALNAVTFNIRDNCRILLHHKQQTLHLIQERRVVRTTSKVISREYLTKTRIYAIPFLCLSQSMFPSLSVLDYGAVSTPPRGKMPASHRTPVPEFCPNRRSADCNPTDPSRHLPSSLGAAGLLRGYI